MNQPPAEIVAVLERETRRVWGDAARDAFRIVWSDDALCPVAKGCFAVEEKNKRGRWSVRRYITEQLPDGSLVARAPDHRDVHEIIEANLQFAGDLKKWNAEREARNEARVQEAKKASKDCYRHVAEEMVKHVYRQRRSTVASSAEPKSAQGFKVNDNRRHFEAAS